MNVLLPNNAFFFLIRHQNISLPQGNEGLRDKNAGEIQKSCLNSLIFGENSILKTHLGTGVIEMDEMIRKNREAKSAMVSGKTWMCGAWRILCGGSVEVTRLGTSCSAEALQSLRGTSCWGGKAPWSQSQNQDSELSGTPMQVESYTFGVQVWKKKSTGS